jgi:HlyD family secretion protein
MMKFLKNLSRKNIILLCAGLVLVIGVTAFFLLRSKAANNEITGPSYEPVQISRGSFDITVSADGILIASDEVNVGFLNEGVVGAVNVETGDLVSEGDVLAELTDLDDLKAEIGTLKIASQKATEAYEYAVAHPEVSLAEAQATLAATNLAVEDAKKGYVTKGIGRCSDDAITEYYYSMQEYKQQADVWQNYLNDGNSGYGHDYILEKLNPLLEKYRLAYVNWQYCQGYSDEEITDSHLTLDIAKANQIYAQTIVEKIASTNGVDEETLAILKAEATLAELKLAQAEMELEGSVITAPCDGLVLSVDIKVDDEVKVKSSIGIAKNTIPVLQFMIDESDYTYMSTGVTGLVLFDALPDKTFSGTVTRVDLGMDNSFFAFSTIKGLFTLDNSTYFDNVTLPYGMMGTVTMITKQVNQAILVPLAAVLSEDDGTPYVYVINNNVPEKRVIEVGVQGDTYFEVLSGLQEGELVATSFDDIETY